MFATDTTIQDNTGTIVLKDLNSNTFATIIPSCGAILQSFNTWHKGGFINVIDGYAGKADFDKNVTAQGFKSCKLSPFACRIKDSVYQFNGAKYTADKFLLGKNALHGLIYDAAFSVINLQADENSASVQLKYEYRGAEKGYPFDFDCCVTYQLKKENELVIITEILNKHNGSIPIQDGWHPYFTLGRKIDELELTLKTDRQIVFDEEIIPTGEQKPYREFYEGKKLGATFFDDCFLLDLTAGQPLCILKDLENGIQVAVRPEITYPYIQLYTPPHRNSIAIENLSAPPDTFNNGVDLIILSPGESTNFATSYIVTSLK